MAKYQSTLTGPQMDAALAAMPDAEAYARGTRNGQEVPSTDPTYHNNAKYFAEKAESAFPESYATGAVRGDIDQSTQTEAWRQQARENMGITDPVWGSITGNISSQTDLTDVVSPLINQWDEQWEIGAIDADNGTKYALAGRIRSANYIPVKGGNTYYFHKTAYYANVRVACYDASKNYIGRATGWLIPNDTFTVPSGAAYILFVTEESSVTYHHDISINYPSTYTGYYPSALPKAKAELEEAINTNGFGEKSGGRNLLNPDPAKRSKSTSYSYKYIAEGALRIGFEDNDTSVDLSGINFGFTKDIANASDAFVWIISNGVLGRTRNNVATNEGGAGQRCPYIFVYPNTQITWKKIFQRYHIIVEQGTGSEAGPYVPFFYSNKQLEILPWADLLWENASPTSAFAAQRIDADLTQYNAYYVLFKYKADTDEYAGQIMAKGAVNRALVPNATISNSAYRELRDYESYIYFYSGYYSGNPNDSYCIPYRIYGIK